MATARDPRRPGTAPDDASAAHEQRYLDTTDRGTAWSWSSHRRQDDDHAAAFQIEDDDETPVYVISVAADLADLHPQTLRAYEREGLLTPARTEGGTRRYSRRDVERLRFIRTLTQDQGLNLAGVRVVLDLGEKLESTRRRIRELEDMVRVLAERVEAPPSSDRFEIVKAPPSGMEVHHLRRRTAERPSSAARNAPRARPVPPPEARRTPDA